MFAKIRAVSSYLPATIEHNAEIVDGRFMKKIGVESRHIAAADESAGDLALAAAEKLFAEHNLNRDATDFILLCTQHPDYQMPHTAAHLQSRLGLDKRVGTMDIALGCSGVSRIDFMIDMETNNVYFNEINTIPGSLSFYLWEPLGMKYEHLLDNMIQLALKADRENHKVVYSFDTNVLEGVKLGGGSKGSKG